MTQTQALAEARDLKATMEAWGVRCSIELQAGRGSDPWAVPAKPLRMHHHTVSTFRVGGNLTPCLSLVKNGRPADNIPGPLCNGYGGYDLVYRIICMGLANHPGAGGPIRIDGVLVPADSARGPTWGTEFEGGLQTWEEIDRLGPDMLQFMGRADNALAEWSERPLTSQLEHKTWTDRKVDRKDFPRDRSRSIALTKTWSTHKPSDPGDDEMHLDEDDKTIVRNILKQEMPAIIDARVEAKLNEMLSEGGSVARVKLRELAKLGADDAIKANTAADPVDVPPTP
jgi:hypothetical protein